MKGERGEDGKKKEGSGEDGEEGEGLRHGYWGMDASGILRMKQKPILKCSHENPWRNSPGSGLMCRCRLWHFTFSIASNSDDVFLVATV